MISQQSLQNFTTGRVPRGAQPVEFFEGLPSGVSHYDLFQLVQNLEKKIGLSSAAVQHLHYLITHTRDVDWGPGAAPIVYRSVQNTAMDRGRTPRQILNLERALHDAGLIQWNDTENYKRFGRRDEKGRIEYGYGVDLTPLGHMYERLVELNEQHMAYMEAFGELKRKISGIRRRIISKLNFAIEQQIDVDDLAARFEELPKVTANAPLSDLARIHNKSRALNAELDKLLSVLAQDLGERQQETSDGSEQNFRHIQPTAIPQSIDIDCNQAVDDDSEEVGQKKSTGIEHLTYEQLLYVASDEFLECITPTASSNKFTDLVKAAARMCHNMDIGRFAWMRACSIMGETAAATAIIIIDRNRKHPLIPVVNPGGVLRGMTDKAKAGDLNLHRSIFGILSRDRAEGAV